MNKRTIIAASLALAACSGRDTTEWIGVVDSSVASPYASFATESGAFKTFADCEQAMKAAAGEQREMPRPAEGFVVRTLSYRCKQGKEGRNEKLIASKYLVLPAKP